ncbi:MAG: lysophospholipid acyltransferase family protein [SAR324 cluster bacterium]|nr:lysophospholipid acyltransferase family protein [SAR324 cluster bacterium]
MSYPAYELTQVLDQEKSIAKLIDLGEMQPVFQKNSWLTWLSGRLEKWLSLDRVNQAYQEVFHHINQENFFQVCLDRLMIDYSFSKEDLQKIPASGPLVIVANHPFGGVDGIILGRILQMVRPDVKILANSILQGIPELSAQVIPVNPFGGKNTSFKNIAGLKDSIKWLRQGGALITFPAGEVSHFQWNTGKLEDAEWHQHIASLVRRSEATVLPVFFSGKNSLLFQVLGKIHPWLRTMLLPRELLNKAGKTLPVFAGHPIPWKKLVDKDDAEMTLYLRAKTYFLKNRIQEPSAKKAFFTMPKAKELTPESVISAVETHKMVLELEHLPVTQKLLQHGEFTVYYAWAYQIKDILTEIGRLREVTFREVGEGTGRKLDLDEFDAYYMHLFMWNHKTSELVGAYRLGLTDAICRQYGIRGLYTNTLFRFKPQFVGQLKNSIELGRSFIRSEYQRKPNSLALLWKGIGEFIVRHPQYTQLFGPVSISQNYHAISKRLMVRFFQKNLKDSSLSSGVKPRNPYRMGGLARMKDKPVMKHIANDLEDMSVLVSEMENDGKGIPVLIRHYLKFNARFVSFNVDKDFSNVIDGLIVVDLLNADLALLRKFMGAEGYYHYAAQHGMYPDSNEKAG